MTDERKQTNLMTDWYYKTKLVNFTKTGKHDGLPEGIKVIKQMTD